MSLSRRSEPCEPASQPLMPSRRVAHTCQMTDPGAALPDHVVSTRTAYDHSSQLYVEHVGTELSPGFETSLDRAALDAFADDIVAIGGGPVLDVGCGPGRATAYLARRGLAISGVDLSPAMITAASLAHPELSFAVGALTDLPTGDRSLVAAVYWYSIIHTPPDQLGRAWVELGRVLRPGGRALIAFQTGADDRIDRPDAYGSSATLTRHHHAIDSVAESLEASGFTIASTLWRQAELDHETTPQAIVVAHLV